MTNLAIFLSGYGGSLVSAIVPIVNSELLLLSLTALVSSKIAVLALAILVAAGHMTGTAILYWLARRAAGWRPSSRRAAVIERWRGRFEGAPTSLAGLMFISALTSVPPFYATTVLCGSLKISFLRFVVVVSSGRLLRFLAVAFFPQLVLGMVRGM